MQHFMASNGHSSSGATNGFRAGSMEDLKLPPQRKSQNMTECVPVPTSEHVAEIVGRQGKEYSPIQSKQALFLYTFAQKNRSFSLFDIWVLRKYELSFDKVELISPLKT